jgi:hypothetical protein
MRGMEMGIRPIGIYAWKKCGKTACFRAQNFFEKTTPGAACGQKKSMVDFCHNKQAHSYKPKINTTSKQKESGKRASFV